MTLFVYPPVTVSTTGLATETTLAALLAATATAAKQDTGNNFLANLLIATATAAKQDVGNASLARIPGNFLSGVSYDYAAQVQASLTDTWTFKTGGAGGTTVKTITITYSTTDKDVISNVVAV